MTDRTCPRCAGPLTTGLEPDQTTGTTPPTVSGRAGDGLPLNCPSCGWTSVDDRPGSLGGDNGGA
jgi:hypothetical protein